MLTLESFTLIGPDEIAAANARWDREHGDPFRAVKIPASWNEGKLLRRGFLTDKQIAKYAERGFYTVELREARKEVAARRAKKADRRNEMSH